MKELIARRQKKGHPKLGFHHIISQFIPKRVWNKLKRKQTVLGTRGVFTVPACALSTQQLLLFIHPSYAYVSSCWNYVNEFLEFLLCQRSPPCLSSGLLAVPRSLWWSLEMKNDVLLHGIHAIEPGHKSLPSLQVAQPHSFLHYFPILGSHISPWCYLDTNHILVYHNPPSSFSIYGLMFISQIYSALI